MKLQVYVPGNETQLLRFLSVRKEKAAIIAGGTHLVPFIRMEKPSFSWLADVSHLSNLRYVRRRKDQWQIGALTRICDLNYPALTKAGYIVFAQVAGNFGGTAIANMATVGGNVAVAATTSDLLPVLLSVDANVSLKSYRKERELKIESLLAGEGRRPDEFIASVNFRVPGERRISLFRKIGRRNASFLALLSVAIFLAYDRKQTITQAGVGFNEIKSHTPGRARNVEGYLQGKVLSKSVIEDAVDRLKLDAPTAPSSEVPAEYWALASRNLLREQLELCVGKMRG